MPTPGKTEKKSEFVSRCIEQVTKEGGREAPQVAAICYSIWDRNKAKSELSAKIGNGDEIICLDNEIDIKKELEELDKKE